MVEYDDYKEINLPWLKKIPSNWDIERNKQFLHESKETVGDKSSEYTLLSLTLRGIVVRDLSDNKGKFPASFDTYKVVEPGDMAFCLFDVDETPRTVGLSNHRGMLTGAYDIFHVDGINAQYLYYYYLALDNVKALRPLYTGLRKTININTFLSQKMPVPPRAEQDQIVRFLDWKVSAINKLIGIRRQEIQELEELKAHAIDKIVIHGLHGSAETHNNDIRWDIDYPSTWKLERLRNLFTFRKGLSITKANLEPTGIPVISYGQVHSKKNSMVGLNDELFKYVNPSYLKTDPSALVGKGDFIFADTSEDLDGSGNCAYIDRDGKIFAGYHSVIAHPKGSTNNKYFAYLFKSPTWRYQIRKKVNAVKVYSITQQILKDVFLLVPSQDEQQEIVQYLDSTCSKIDSLIESTHKKIAELTEMKSVIISDAVTGKIDVRNVTVPEYEHVDDIVDDDSENNEETETDGEEA